MRIALTVLAVALAVPAAGCSGDGGAAGPTAESQPAGPATSTASPEPAALRAGLAGLYAGDHATVADEADAACFADALLSRVSVEELRDAGLVRDDGSVAQEAVALPRPLATDWVEAQVGCVDFYDELARAQADATKGETDEASYAGCLREAISVPRVKEALVAALTGTLDDPAVAALAAAQSTCSSAGVRSGATTPQMGHDKPGGGP